MADALDLIQARHNPPDSAQSVTEPDLAHTRDSAMFTSQIQKSGRDLL